MAQKDTPADEDRANESSRQTASTGLPIAPSRRRLLHVLGAGGVAGIAGCSSNPEGDTEPGANGAETERELQKSATIGQRDEIAGENKIMGGVNEDYTRIFEPLCWPTDNLEVGPWLATDWRQTDEKTWEFDLREGVKFHNGDPLNADAVVFSLKERLTKSGDWIYSWAHTRPEGVKKIDDMTVEITNIRPFAGFPGLMTHLIWSIQHPDRTQGNPIGTGPYKFEEKKEGQHVKVSAFEGYWRGTPQTEELTIRVLTDRNTRALALKGGEIDVGHELPPDQFDAIKNSENTDTVKTEQPAPVWASFEAKPPTTDTKLRKALNYAVSQTEIIEGSQNGIGIPARGPIPRVVWWSAHDSLPTYGPDKAKAKELVEESSYNGETLKLLGRSGGEIPSPDIVAQIIQQSANDVGVDIEIQIMGGGAFGEALEKGEGHIYLLEDSIPRAGTLFMFRLAEDTAQHYLKDFERREEVYSLSSKAVGTTDREVFEDSLVEAQQLVMENAYIIPLFYFEYISGVSTDIGELDFHPIPENTQWENLKHFE